MSILLKNIDKKVSAVAIVCISFALMVVAGPSFASSNGPNFDLIPHAIEDSQDTREYSLPSAASAQLAEKTPKVDAGQIAKNAEVAQATPDVNDPLESMNRVIFQFNEFVHALILRPMAELYTFILPDEGQKAVHNFLKNLRSPVVLANDLLQGEMERAWVTTKRMAINSTLGVGGTMDVADAWGIKPHSEDLGQTLAVWGVPDGFYLVLPIFGPSNPRDAVGTFLDSYLDPVSHWLDNTDRDDWSTARTLVSGVDEFAGVMNDLQKLKETSVDYYAALRSISRQKRKAEIRNGKTSDAPLPDLKYDFNADLNTK